MLEVLLLCVGFGWLANISISVYAHRALAHRAVALHPAPAHVFRFLIFLTTGTRVRAWVAVHRKHHAYVDREGDPHSPVVHGIAAIFFAGYRYYFRESTNATTLQRFGHDCPDDWIERNLYEGRSNLGLALLAAIYIGLLGPGLGLLGFVSQLMWMPLCAGVINGLGHHAGYRNHETRDSSRNVTPLALVIAGEELHNNHHRFPRSAKFSTRWWEFDVGWAVIRTLAAFGLARELYVYDRKWRPGAPLPAVRPVEAAPLEVAGG
ncbi:fatty acid desaturase [Nannocystis radixulma]|uniref:Fatty acid desaturase n=1 Tax=Nannocystis radixulma TaxID=2995305 RepID=A0ABT5AYT1_9BACT|nr:fatty acid desaturase [Nannocystis radixulma]MDC0666988.1 fatty acid desaturase [Nannocystis radixulma]